MQKINHNTVVNGYKSLKAMPISGPVRIQVLSGHTLIGETKAKRNGEWESSINVEDGDYTVRFIGYFRPIGEGGNSQYTGRVYQKDVPLSVSTPVTVSSLNSLSNVTSAYPQKDVFFGSDGLTFTPLPIPEYLVDLLSTQEIGGQKAFTKETSFRDTVVLGSKLQFTRTQSSSFSTSSIPDAYVYLNSRSELTFQDSITGVRPLSTLVNLSTMNDVINAIPSDKYVLSGNGNKWTSRSLLDLDVVTATDDQTISGVKTFTQPITAQSYRFGGTNASIYVTSTGMLAFTDNSGTYFLNKMGAMHLTDLCDVIDSTATLNNLLVANGINWQSKNADSANLMTKTGEQIISGLKIFDNGIVLNTTISGTAIDKDLNYATADHCPTSLAVKRYIDEHITISSVNLIFNDIPQESPNGVITDFTLTNTPIATDILVFLNGQLQTKDDDYVVSGNVVSFIGGRIPREGDVILVTYRKT